MTSPALAVLQLDTRFPRLPGDIASPDSYNRPVRIQTICDARVDDVVSRNPDGFDLGAFEQAVRTSPEPLITTSCGFMITAQDHLSKLTPHRFVSSSLTALPALQSRYKDSEILILTFDADTLKAPAYRSGLNGFSGPVVGLRRSDHLCRVIKDDQPDMDTEQVRAELSDLFTQTLNACQGVRAVLLECTNLSPHKAVFRAAFNGEIVDCLSVLEDLSPGLVKPEFLI